MARCKKVEVITEAKPHTIKKFELIEKYVEAWAYKILGYKGNSAFGSPKGIIFIDCMSNSGVYRDENGGRIEGTALHVAKSLNRIIADYLGKKAVLIFNELESARIEHLEKEINAAQLDNIEVSYHNMDCDLFLQQLDLESYKNNYNTLLLYDPYNASINWTALKPFLNIWGEVIINHMSSDTIRGAAQAKKKEVIERYEESYQRDISSLLEASKDDLDRIIISIIQNNVNKAADKYYISYFPFHNRTNGCVYSLIHCSPSIEGIKLYKKVAWKTFGDKSSMKTTDGSQNQFSFDFNGEGVSDTSTDEECFFVKDIAKYIYEKYKSRGTVSLDEIYADLDVHPFFPSDGYKNEIKSELKDLYHATIKNGLVIFSYE